MLYFATRKAKNAKIYQNLGKTRTETQNEKAKEKKRKTTKKNENQANEKKMKKNIIKVCHRNPSHGHINFHQNTDDHFPTFSKFVIQLLTMAHMHTWSK